MNKIRVAVSACLLGNECRYDGRSNLNQAVKALASSCEFVPVCPEVMGGLPIPRECAEIRGTTVITENGNDVTSQFVHGAELAFEAVRRSGCVLAILKARSPSCGVKSVYDGSFSHTVVDGSGVFAELLEKEGIPVFSEESLDLLADYLCRL